MSATHWSEVYMKIVRMAEANKARLNEQDAKFVGQMRRLLEEGAPPSAKQIGSLERIERNLKREA